MFNKISSGYISIIHQPAMRINKAILDNSLYEPGFQSGHSEVVVFFQMYSTVNFEGTCKSKDQVACNVK